MVRPEGLELSTFWFVAEQGQNLSACCGVGYKLMDTALICAMIPRRDSDEFRSVRRARKAAQAQTVNWMLSCVDKLAPFQRRKRLDGFSGLLVGEPKVVEAL